MLRCLRFLGLVFTLLPDSAAAQPDPAAGSERQGERIGARLRVFLDCECFEDFIRDEITWVDFARQPKDADVHLLSTDRVTGGGGRELVLRFVGRGRFEGVTTELRVVTEVAASENRQRAQVLQTMTVGLLADAARDSLPPGLEVAVRTPAPVGPGAAAVRDRWNFWVFSISTGAELEAEETNRDLQWNLNVTADRVTDRWKLAFGS